MQYAQNQTDVWQDIAEDKVLTNVASEPQPMQEPLVVNSPLKREPMFQAAIEQGLDETPQQGFTATFMPAFVTEQRKSRLYRKALQRREEAFTALAEGSWQRDIEQQEKIKATLGEDFFKQYQSSTPSAQSILAGIKFVETFKQPGETHFDAVNRYAAHFNVAAEGLHDSAALWDSAAAHLVKAKRDRENAISRKRDEVTRAYNYFGDTVSTQIANTISNPYDHHTNIPWVAESLLKAGYDQDKVDDMIESAERAAHAFNYLMSCWGLTEGDIRAEMEKLKKSGEGIGADAEERRAARVEAEGAEDLDAYYWQHAMSKMLRPTGNDRAVASNVAWMLSQANKDGLPYAQEGEPELDEMAVALFSGALEKFAARSQTYESEFGRNAAAAFRQFWQGVGNAGGDALYFLGADPVFNTDAEMRITGIISDSANRSLKPAELKGELPFLDSIGYSAVGILTELGTVAGQEITPTVATLGAGAALRAAGKAMGVGSSFFVNTASRYPSISSSMAESYMAQGKPNARAYGYLSSLPSTAAESLFGVYGVGLGSKGWQAMTSAAGKIPGVARTATRLEGSWVARYLGGASMETFGEIVVEPFLGELLKQEFIEGVNVTAETFGGEAPFERQGNMNELFREAAAILDDPEQAVAIGLYCFLLGGLGVSADIAQAKRFREENPLISTILGADGQLEARRADMQHEADVAAVIQDDSLTEEQRQSRIEALEREHAALMQRLFSSRLSMPAEKLREAAQKANLEMMENEEARLFFDYAVAHAAAVDNKVNLTRQQDGTILLTDSRAVEDPAIDQPLTLKLTEAQAQNYIALLAKSKWHSDMQNFIARVQSNATIALLTDSQQEAEEQTETRGQSNTDITYINFSELTDKSPVFANIAKTVTEEGGFHSSQIADALNIAFSNLQDNSFTAVEEAAEDIYARIAYESETTASTTEDNEFYFPGINVTETTKDHALRHLVLFANGNVGLKTVFEEIAEVELKQALSRNTELKVRITSALLELNELIPSSSKETLLPRAKELKDYKASDIIEAFSKLQRADIFSNYGRYMLSPKAKALMNYVLSRTELTKDLADIAQIYNEYRKQRSNKNVQSLEDLLYRFGGWQMDTFQQAVENEELQTFAGIAAMEGINKVAVPTADPINSNTVEDVNDAIESAADVEDTPAIEEQDAKLEEVEAQEEEEIKANTLVEATAQEFFNRFYGSPYLDVTHDNLPFMLSNESRIKAEIVEATQFRKAIKDKDWRRFSSKYIKWLSHLERYASYKGVQLPVSRHMETFTKIFGSYPSWLTSGYNGDLMIQTADTISSNTIEDIDTQKEDALALFFDSPYLNATTENIPLMLSDEDGVRTEIDKVTQLRSDIKDREFREFCSKYLKWLKHLELYARSKGVKLSKSGHMDAFARIFGRYASKPTSSRDVGLTINFSVIAKPKREQSDALRSVSVSYTANTLAKIVNFLRRETNRMKEVFPEDSKDANAARRATHIAAVFHAIDRFLSPYKSGGVRLTRAERSKINALRRTAMTLIRAWRSGKLPSQHPRKDGSKPSYSTMRTDFLRQLEPIVHALTEDRFMKVMGEEEAAAVRDFLEALKEAQSPEMQAKVVNDIQTELAKAIEDNDIAASITDAIYAAIEDWEDLVYGINSIGSRRSTQKEEQMIEKTFREAIKTKLAELLPDIQALTATQAKEMFDIMNDTSLPHARRQSKIRTLREKHMRQNMRHIESLRLGLMSYSFATVKDKIEFNDSTHQNANEWNKARRNLNLRKHALADGLADSIQDTLLAVFRVQRAVMRDIIRSQTPKLREQTKAQKAATYKDIRKSVVSEIAEQNLNAIMASMWEEIANLADAHIRNEIVTKLEAAAERYRTKLTDYRTVKKNGLSAQAQYRVDLIHKILNMSDGDKAEDANKLMAAEDVMSQLQELMQDKAWDNQNITEEMENLIKSSDAVYSAWNHFIVQGGQQTEVDNKNDVDFFVNKVTWHDMRAWLNAYTSILNVYGNLRDGSSEFAVSALANFNSILAKGKAIWEARQSLLDEQIDFYYNEAMTKGLSLTDEMIKAKDKSRFTKAKEIPMQFMSPGQLFLYMQGVSATKELAIKTNRDLAKAHVMLLLREKAQKRAMVEGFAKACGIALSEDPKVRAKQVEKMLDGIFADFVEMVCKTRKTGIHYMDSEAQPEIELSYAQMMHVLLIYEQDQYANSGVNYNRAVRDKIRELLKVKTSFKFEGKTYEQETNLMNFAYHLRDIMRTDGVARAFAERTGTFMPDNEKYFPARFVHTESEMSSDQVLNRNTYMSPNVYAFLHARAKSHDAEPAPENALSLFETEMAHRNNYLYMYPVVEPWSRLLRRKGFQQVVKSEIGLTAFGQLNANLNTLQEAARDDLRVKDAMHWFARESSAQFSVAVLAGYWYTLMRQSSALAHGAMFSRDAATAVVEPTTKFVSNQGVITWKQLLKLRCFRARYQDNHEYQNLLRYRADRTWSSLSKLPRLGMNALGWVDIQFNVAAAGGLYQHKYEELAKENKRLTNPLSENQMHEICESTVEQMLDVLAQPLRHSQKATWYHANRGLIASTIGALNTENFNKLGYITAEAMRVKAETGSSMAAAGRFFALTSTIGVPTAAVIWAISAIKGQTPDEEDDLSTWAIWYSLLAFRALTGISYFETTPVIGERVSSLLNALGNKRNYSRTLGNNVFPEISRTHALIGKLIDMHTSDKPISVTEYIKTTKQLAVSFSVLSALVWGGNAKVKALSHLSALLLNINMAFNAATPAIDYAHTQEKKEKKRKKARLKKLRDEIKYRHLHT